MGSAGAGARFVFTGSPPLNWLPIELIPLPVGLCPLGEHHPHPTLPHRGGGFDSALPLPRWGRVGVGVTRPMRRRSPDGRPPDLPIPRCSRIGGCDSLRPAGTRFARPPVATCDRVDRRQFPGSARPRGTQNRRCSGRSAPDGGICIRPFDADAVSARPAVRRPSWCGVRRGLGDERRARGASSFFDLRHPLPILPHRGGGLLGPVVAGHIVSHVSSRCRRSGP